MKFTESEYVELKELITSDFKKEIIAFANTAGGDIYVGIANDGEIIGVDNCETEMERISSMIHDAIHPDLIPFTVVEALKIEGKNVIHVNVSRGGRPPYYLREKGLKPSGVYVRHGVTAVPASEELIRDMIKSSDGVTYDKARSVNQELTFAFAQHFFKDRSIAFMPENMRTLGLIDTDGFYTNAALLLSDQCEHSIKCAVFEGEGKTYFKARKEFNGSVLKQLEDVYEYISLLNNLHADFVGLERVETPDYPVYAIREALLNTIVHRDYNYSGSTIINIFSNRIEFVSIGGLVKGITVTDIMRGVSQSRNMILANVFYRLKLIESYGTGIQRIVESYNGFSTPEFLTADASFVTILPNTKKNEEVLYVRDGGAPEYKVMQMFEKKEIVGRKDVEELLNCSSFPARNVLNALIKQNKIKAIGAGRSTKYTLNK